MKIIKQIIIILIILLINNSYAFENKKNKKILIIGDSIACSLNNNIKKQFKDYDIINKCKPSSGLINKNFYNWYTNLNLFLNNFNINNNDIVLIVIGTNDNYFYTNNYNQKIKEFLKILDDKNLNYYFIQSPSSSKLNNIEYIRDDQKKYIKNIIETNLNDNDLIKDKIHLNKKGIDKIIKLITIKIKN